MSKQTNNRSMNPRIRGTHTHTQTNERTNERTIKRFVGSLVRLNDCSRAYHGACAGEEGEDSEDIPRRVDAEQQREEPGRGVEERCIQ